LYENVKKNKNILFGMSMFWRIFTTKLEPILLKITTLIFSPLARGQKISSLKPLHFCPLAETEKILE